MRRGRQRESRKPSSQRPRAESILKGAEEALQRAERRRGEQALPACQEALAKFREALQSTSPSLSDSNLATARYGLATSLRYLAECLLTASRERSTEEVEDAEEQASASARQLLEEAVDVYKQVTDQGGNMQLDAMVDCGNALSQLAELADPHPACELLSQAVNAYETAVSKMQDTSVFSNLGDVLVALAEHQAELGEQAVCRGTYGRAMDAYSHACSMSSSEAGDDLPGLLHNWGVGLHSAGTHLQDWQALQEAAEKLRAAKDFERGDVVILNALGDVLVAMADAASEAAKKQLLQQGLEEGFVAALRINRRNTDALIGSAEIHLHMARLTGNEAAAQHFSASMQHYAQALEQPKKLGSFKDRCDVQYNYACAAALAGQTQVARSALQSLLDLHAIAPIDISTDDDLQSVKQSNWSIKNAHPQAGVEEMSS